MPYIGNLYLYFELADGVKFDAIKDSISALLMKGGISQFSMSTKYLLFNQELREVIAVRTIKAGDRFYADSFRDEPASFKRAVESFKVKSVKTIYQDWETGLRVLWSSPEEKPSL